MQKSVLFYSITVPNLITYVMLNIERPCKDRFPYNVNLSSLLPPSIPSLVLGLALHARSALPFVLLASARAYTMSIQPWFHCTTTLLPCSHVPFTIPRVWFGVTHSFVRPHATPKGSSNHSTNLILAGFHACRLLNILSWLFKFPKGNKKKSYCKGLFF